MPTPRLSDELAIEALNLVEQYGSTRYAKKALGDKMPPEATIDARVIVAKSRGLRPTFNREQARIFERKRLGKMHIVIPDVQARPGVRLDHLQWVGNYIAEKQPDTIICIGDFADIESLSKYDRGTIRGENKRLQNDLWTAKKAMQLLTAPFQGVAGYAPDMHLTMGNHEDRLDRFANENPYLEEIVGTHMLSYEDFGWVVHPFLKPVCIDGVDYCHYFITGQKGRPFASAQAMKVKRSRSSIMGHAQQTDVAFDPISHQWFMFCGVCNLHDEHYLGPQGNDYRRQILVLHEVEDGKFDPMWVSLRFLERRTRECSSALR